jgi:hypothetical protein
MFVIPPLASQESYYNDIAQNAWNKSIESNNEQCVRQVRLADVDTHDRAAALYTIKK